MAKRSNSRAGRGREQAHQLSRVTIDHSLPTPLYHQIYALLRDGIVRGRFPNNSFLPSEQDLSTRFGVSRITAKRALDELATAGLAVREQGRGTRVHSVPGRTVVRGRIAGLVQSLHAHARYSVALFEFGYAPAPADIATVLGLSEGEEIQRAIRVWNGPKGPFSHLTTFVPGRIGRSWTREDLLKQPMISLFESHGRRVGRAEERIGATLADRETAARLAVKQGAPLLMITRTVFDTRGAAIEHIVALYPPDRYQYVIHLE